MESTAIDFSACIKTASHLTHSAVHNVCDGSVYTVPHGLLDYAHLALLALTGVLMTGGGAVLFGVAVSFLRD